MAHLWELVTRAHVKKSILACLILAECSAKEISVPGHHPDLASLIKRDAPSRVNDRASDYSSMFLAIDRKLVRLLCASCHVLTSLRGHTTTRPSLAHLLPAVLPV